MDLIETLAEDLRIVVRDSAQIDPDGRCVIYWMRRAQRAFDNPALESAIVLANAIEVPVVVFFALRMRHPHANVRHYTFMIEGLADTAARLERRHIGFVMRTSVERFAGNELARFATAMRPAAIVTDRNPLSSIEGWRATIPQEIRVPVLNVDANVIVPTALIGREHYAARTIRPKIHTQLERFLVPIGNRKVRVAWQQPRGLQSHQLESIVPASDTLDAFAIDRTIEVAPDFTGGTTAALARLKRFVGDGLAHYAERRNAPQLDGTSGLSPYLHYGQIGPHTIALAVLDAEVPADNRRAFLEELIVRRELAINFTTYNRQYKSIESCEPWALGTLERHAVDRRSKVYTEHQLEHAETHDPLWNAAQRQMVEAGWMHGYMRMYWAKKILEWSPSPRAAHEIAVRLNDRYELDGRDPNGYAGIAWAIGGKHDRAWGPERSIYGTVRYMSAASTGRKFDSKAYIARWMGSSATR
jgi:deoxyribodipyrimidine photo-lyase